MVELISVIIPYYKGKKYIYNLLENLNTIADTFMKEYNGLIETIIVNDSPTEKIDLNTKLYPHLSVNIYENEKNSGIHASRINGLKKAKAPYILFLDQDDELINNAFCHLYNKAISSSLDVVLGNGYFEINGNKEIIFGNKWSQKYATKENSYILIRDFIVSPGQCLIKKTSIPDFWLNNKMDQNGADDYLLWLTMFDEKAKFISCEECIYIHKDTNVNLSSDEEKMNISVDNMLNVLSNSKNYDKRKFKLLKRRINYKRVYKKSIFCFILYSLINIDLFIINVIYRLRWRGALIR